MTDLFRSLAGEITLELTSADMAQAIHQLNESKIQITGLRIIDELTVHFTVTRKDLKRIKIMADRRGNRVKILSRTGLFWRIWSLRHRPVLVCGMLILFGLSLFIPSRVLFIEVEGNILQPDNLILDTAKDAGIRFGASRRAVRSERMKNELLDAMPQLQWAGVNTFGCKAVISVKERALESHDGNKYMAENIVASQDGIVTEVVVSEGTGVCTVGQAIRKGQLLISGYTDCGGVIITRPAKGEVFAQTSHEMTVVTPSENRIRTKLEGMRANYSLHIGKKRINFYKGSGIYDGSCVKMVRQYYLTLPGGYRLPISITKQLWTKYQTESNQINEEQTRMQLSAFSRRQLRIESISLDVVESQEFVAAENGLFVLRGIYDCTEMVGRVQGEFTGELHGKTD